MLSEEDKKFYNDDGSLKISIYQLNTLHMAIMLSTNQFMTYLLHLQLRYVEGDLIENSEYCAGSDLVAIIFGAIIYKFLGGLKATYVLGFTISTIGSLGILFIENNYQDDPSVLHPS